MASQEYQERMEKTTTDQDQEDTLGRREHQVWQVVQERLEDKAERESVEE